MALLDDLKAKADLNGDGTISKEDLDALRSEENSGTLDKLKALADQNADGKISMDDVSHFDFGTTLDGVKDFFNK